MMKVLDISARKFYLCPMAKVLTTS